MTQLTVTLSSASVFRAAQSSDDKVDTAISTASALCGCLRTYFNLELV
jgi:uncharacterized protein (UPF0212 family)